MTGELLRRNTYTRIIPYRAGVFDFFDVVFQTDEEDIYRKFMLKPGSDEFYSSFARWRTYQMSDHHRWLKIGN